jgi:hypothetical protein
MAQPTASFSTYDAVGNREDLSDVIDMISPSSTPVYSMLAKTKATATKHEWQKDSLAAASGANFVIEGDDATTDASTATVRLDNQCGISDKVARVTGTQESVNSAGRRSEMAHQVMKRSKELKTDIETSILQNVAKVVGNDTLARKVAGLQTWVKTNANDASDATASAGTGADVHTDGTARALTETMFEDVLAQAWNSGGEPSMAVCAGFQKRKIAQLNGNSTPTQDASSGKVYNSVDVYCDPLGSEVDVVPDHFVPTDVVFFVDPDHLKFATLRPFMTKDLAKTGDSERKQILTEWTLEVSNEAAHGGIYDLTVA